MSSICETVIFGKGNGESVLVHLNNNEWLITDSCLNNDNNPAALDYLRSNGIDPVTAVKIIVISHFHDDHIAGILETIKTCINAKVYISAALTNKEFVKYIFEFNTPEVSNKAKEFSELFAYFRLSKRRNIEQVVVDKCLYRNGNITVEALSPCDTDMQESRDEFINHAFNAGRSPHQLQALPKGKPNHYCIVLRIYDSTLTTSHDILLGADLEIKTNRGWDSVCQAICAPKGRKVGLFKIPHHGSQTGYHAPTWQSLISQEPIGIITTYDSSSLPREDMVNLYKSHTKELYCTADPKHTTSYIQNKEAKKTLASLKVNIRSKGAVDRFGFVIIKQPFLQPSILLQGSAVQLK